MIIIPLKYVHHLGQGLYFHTKYTIFLFARYFYLYIFFDLSLLAYYTCNMSDFFNIKKKTENNSLIIMKKYVLSLKYEK